MNLNYSKCREMAEFWEEISERLDNCMTYMCNPAHFDGEYINIACDLLNSAQELCDYRAKVLKEKCVALENLAGGME